MNLAELLSIRSGITAVIGGGGKTTLLRALGTELAADGARVLLCATTKLFPFADLPNLADPTETALAEALEARRLVCAGTPVPGTGKLTAPNIPVARLAALADYVLAEADGAAGRPLKAHAPHEPVIPPEANQTVLVIGASGFGRPIAEAAHRPALYARLAGAEESAPASLETEAAVLLAEGLHTRVFINQVETAEARRQAAALAARLSCPVLAGSLRRKERYPC
nr:selenium cofactor biosynthesis protein YqeC [uncultured Oscillibacter sp.]